MAARGRSDDDEFCEVRTSGLISLKSCGHCPEQRCLDDRTVMIVIL